MSSFVFWMTAFCALELVCKIVCMSLDHFPERTRGGLMVDALFCLGAVCWGIYLLAK